MIDTNYDMDTGEYETNALVINNISSVNFAFYDPVSPNLASFGSNAIELETTLRRDGFLAYFDTIRRGVWLFRLSQKDKLQGSQSATSIFPKSIGSAGFTFALSEEGVFESAALVKNRTHGPNSANTPASSSSSGSAVLDPSYRNTQSATLPSGQPFPTISEQDIKAVSLDSKSVSSASVKDVYEHFISAALSAVSSSFCVTTSAIPLSSRTFLLPRTSQDDFLSVPAVLASLRIYLTTTGNLVISFALSLAEGIINLSENLGHPLPSLGVTVLAAPLGMFASCHPITISETTATEGSYGQSPDTQVMRLRSERDDGPWRNICSNFLQARNIPSSYCESQNWVGLQRMRRKPTEQNIDGKRTPVVGAPSISWPVNLCFCKIFSRLSIGGEIEDQSADRKFDALKVAKQWFLSAGERDNTLEKNKKERESAIAREASLADGQAQHANGLSPLALHRSGNTGAPPGGLYLTPPEPNAQSIIGATPSMDDSASSPGNHVTTAAPADMESTRNVSYNDDWENTETKRERIGSSFESENLFGELGPDMFGDTDITEADFNFFDEQPGDMGLSSLDLPSLQNTDSSLDLGVGLPTSQESHMQTGAPDIHLPDATPSPTFTKPELKHARSSLGEEVRRHGGLETNRSQSAALKRPASPFNPDTVFKRIRASLDNHKAVHKNSRMDFSFHSSIFDKVEFGPGLSMVNSKYEGSGRFDFSLERQAADTKSSSANEPPTTDYLRRHSKNRKGLKELPAKVGQLLSRSSGTQVPTSDRASPSGIDEAHSDADEISLVSDQDDSSYDSDEPLSPVKSSSVRRRLVDDDGESLATSFRELESVDVSSPHLPLEFPQTCKSEADLLTKYFADPEPPFLQYSLPDDLLIMAAQILTDQFSTSTLFVNHISQPLDSRVDRHRQLTGLTRKSIQDIKSCLPPCLATATEYQFRPFIEIQDVPLLGQPTRMQPRPPGADQTRPSNLFQIPSPHFELRRYESKLSVLPSAVSFWESLGLSPSPGNKDINAICIFPDYEGLGDDMLVFTDRMRSIYESLKLGSFNRLPSSSGSENGMFPFSVEKDSAPFSKSMAACVSKICQTLASMVVEEINFVVFFVYSPDAIWSIVECCAVFNQIFEDYKQLLANKKLASTNDLALQLIPQEFVASSNSVAMPSPFDFSRLAMEIYDRCTQFGSAATSPAITLEQPPPRMIDFKLTTNPSASLLHENTCLHIAYAQSIDGRWITAAWTDNRGSQQMTASYCLGRKGKSLSRPVADVATEIWGATRDFISTWKVHWRIIIAKCGVMEQSEIELWSTLAQGESKASISLTLIAVDTDPSLQLLPPVVKVSNNALSVFYTTPVSTPQGSMVSPEQSGNPTTPIRENVMMSAATPGGENNGESENEATLTEITDQTWGAVLSHRLNNSTSLTELNPALISGYLVKRGGTRIEDPPTVMEVNIIHNEGNPRAYESLLREMLTYYRGLGTLARARGMVDKETDIRPWHIAAAEKAVKALYMLM
ncbi:mediator complex subunit 13 C-terminal-domain-containing protein [Hypoxylon trugodes]|uniref:mediator complex subunit 13 C-terminal-domain-containing protein n=1 Tax=Hypoxylon trugodes TaxID=326681 RepID=UPI00219442E9|nr:mediator complex subunit 13 C-terminal-domain-containing protein [Hypoxylon trugodes]KAI1387621.1 mediator complex subunit 13 C-terminal-domain-containing protein [Hypoxylon trugodes]